MLSHSIRSDVLEGTLSEAQPPSRTRWYLVNTAHLADHVTSGGGLARIDVAVTTMLRWLHLCWVKVQFQMSLTEGKAASHIPQRGGWNAVVLKMLEKICRKICSETGKQ